VYSKPLAVEPKLRRSDTRICDPVCRCVRWGAWPIVPPRWGYEPFWNAGL